MDTGLEPPGFSHGEIQLVDTASHACAVNDWPMVELRGCPSAWPSDASKVDIVVGHWCLQVSSDALWFNGRPKSGNETIQSRELPLTELAAALNASDEHDNEPFVAAI